MTFFLTVLLLLVVGGGTAVAGHYKPNELCMTSEVLGGGPMHEVPCERLFKESDVREAVQSFTKAVARETKHDKDCLAKMQAAMKAMDVFINNDDVPNARSIVQTFKDFLVWGNSLRPAVTDTLAQKALRLWNEAKKDCWSTP